MDKEGEGMIVCERCGYEGEYTGKACPKCRAEFSFT